MTSTDTRIYSTGKRKTAVARVWLSNGSGSLTVNGPDGPIEDAAILRDRLGGAIDQALAGLLRNALLVEA